MQTTNPFPAGEQGSSTFRIPSLITLADGTMLAACDARWGAYADGGGLDTIVSYSKDQGVSWNSCLANERKGQGKSHDPSFAAFIDPAMATDGHTVYLLVDLFPSGYALNGAKQVPLKGHTGFLKNGKLALRKQGTDASDPNNYVYYLDEGNICHIDGTVVLRDCVDPYFYVKDSEHKIDTNLFYEDAPYQPWPTNYLYLTSSKDGGRSWSEPQLLPLKKKEEQTYLVGPGRGIVTTGLIVFSCYSYTEGKQAASIIYSTDGMHWERSTDAADPALHWTSEGVPVEITPDIIRLFYRDGNKTLFYTDFQQCSDKTFVIKPMISTKVGKTSNNQLSAIRCKGGIDSEFIFVSTANGEGNQRQNGVIHVFSLHKDAAMEWINSYPITGQNEYFGYSCLTECADGRIALLYESDWAAMTYRCITKEELINIRK